ncbi:TetR family transcriptional regulator [Pseudomonas cavernae]|uniref:TetR family transcriptional regulator n=1 Tax=Pseudomonas cavernae TaxID=2320867 RepID=A0A385Z307_9PSED|nr:TetR family transcriptional regulator [Pseudomonas cavernae]AYC33466.1 TetR family transcriptional regulator [Pseudomonas cavernae]
MASSKREQLLDTALDLFAREGYHATGIDRILAESGVAKMTLYKHFKSKDELIVAALESRQRQIAEDLSEAQQGLGARERVLGVFDFVQTLTEGERFCGCLFINAAAEFHDRGHPIHRQAAAYKAVVREYFQRNLAALKVADAERLARQLQFLLEGAMTMAHIQGPASQGREAREAAEQLLAAAGV